MNNALKKLEDDIAYLHAEIHRERQARDNAVIKLRAELVDRIDAVVDSINTRIDAADKTIERLDQLPNDTMDVLHPEDEHDSNTPSPTAR